MCAAVSVALRVHGAAADAFFFDINAVYVHAPLRGNPTFAYFKSLVPFLEGIVTRHVLQKIANSKDPVVPLPLALYGLLRAGFDYSASVRQKLCAAHWRESAADKNLYRRRRGGVLKVLVLYVDEEASLRTTASVTEAMHELVRMFRITKSAQLLPEGARARPIRYLGNKEINIVCFTDSDLDPGRSTSGVAIFLASGGNRQLVEWSSRRQMRVTASTAEASLVEMHSAVQNATFPIATFLDDALAKWPRTTVRRDNENSLGAVSKCFSPVQVHANKTQRISLAWLHDMQSEHLIAFEHVPTRANVADPFTKPVSADVFCGHARARRLSSFLLSPSTGDSLEVEMAMISLLLFSEPRSHIVHPLRCEIHGMAVAGCPPPERGRFNMRPRNPFVEEPHFDMIVL
ncbi:hypothetical protein FVE85_7770 [Porphyridium purpureum]|uniref:Reverse transcriptase Ty1/copia-type domain-containing protein n=1 Tax=Porphyridium purpureum TaxID=35688 RepID=A0A5J4YIY2_PORPP|nr:hypothetical protein FVE85_7770 [Porphyridium purpureum]|eukprot:POR3806..scf210_14